VTFSEKSLRFYEKKGTFEHLQIRIEKVESWKKQKRQIPRPYVQCAKLSITYFRNKILKRLMMSDDDKYLYDFPKIEKSETFEVNLQELFKVAKIDYTSLYLQNDPWGSLGFCSEYDLSAEDYVEFAKADFAASNDIRARINAVTNAKRAIDCQIDSILYTLKYNFKKEPVAIMQNMIKQFCDIESKLALKNNRKLAFISALNLSSMVLISETRTLRHSVEHIYSIPKSRETKKAIEVAELFIGQTNNRSLTFGNLGISDTKLEAANKLKRTVGIWFKFENSELCYYEFEGNNVKEYICKLLPDQPEYWLVIRMCFSSKSSFEFIRTFSDLLQIAKKKIPKDKIKIKTNDCF
jgi:hypothetical protein